MYNALFFLSYLLSNEKALSTCKLGRLIIRFALYIYTYPELTSAGFAREIGLSE